MTRTRRRMVMTWAALAGFSAAAAFSALLKEGEPPMATASLPAGMQADYDGAPMATGALGAAGTTDIVALKQEITRLRTSVRRGDIEKKALLKRMAEMRGENRDRVDEMITGSLPASARDSMRDALGTALAAEMNHAPGTVTASQFAIEVAVGQSLDALQKSWEGLSQSHAALLEGFDPLVGVREDARGISLRLLAGPIANAADAVDLCAQLRNGGTLCAAVPYDGQRLLQNR